MTLSTTTSPFTPVLEIAYEIALAGTSFIIGIIAAVNSYSINIGSPVPHPP